MLNKIKLKKIKKNINQIIALTEKNLKLNLRFKITFIATLLAPLFSIIMPMIIMSKFFAYSHEFGTWTADNLFLFQLLAFNVYLLIEIIYNYGNIIFREKFWNTLPLLVISPINRFNILLSIFLTRLIIIAIPFTILFILCYLISPISLITIFSIIILYFLIAIIFSGVGLILAILIISKESIFKALEFAILFTFIISCITYPYEIFPTSIQIIINLNPFYYIFDILRLVWIENNLIISITSHPIHFIILIISSLSFPWIGIYIFNYIFKKYGIVGY
ncbi:MAG: ABC transporter permease [Promethearchaeota archaeon]